MRGSWGDFSATLRAMNDSPRRRTLATRATGNLIVAGHTSAHPTSSEFDEFIESTVKVHAAHGKEVRCLVLTDGGSPDERQRQALAARVDVSSVPVAVVSSVASVRFVVSTFSFLNRAIKSFSPTELDGILRHLGLSPAQLPQIQAMALDIQKELGGLRVVDALLGHRR